MTRDHASAHSIAPVSCHLARNASHTAIIELRGDDVRADAVRLWYAVSEHQISVVSMRARCDRIIAAYPNHNL